MKDECDCDCHNGAKIHHWQYSSGTGYERSPCSCEIKDNPNYVPEDIRKTWE